MNAAGKTEGPSTSEPVQRYSRVQMAAHWASAVAMFILLGCMWGRQYVEEFALRVSLFDMHRQMGLVTLLLLVVRLLAKKFCPKKKPSGPQPGRLELLAATSVHVAIYFMLFAMPLAGWLISNAQGHDVHFLGSFTLPRLVGKNEGLEDILLVFHEYGANILVGMVGLHIAAAFFHHFVKKDHVLAAMVPLIRKSAVKGGAVAGRSPGMRNLEAVGGVAAEK